MLTLAPGRTPPLCAQVWLDAQSALAKGTEVTVEPEGAPVPSAVPTPGSFFATIEEGSTTEGGEVLYKIRRSGALDLGLVDPTPVPRHRLRERKAAVCRAHTGHSAEL